MWSAENFPFVLWSANLKSLGNTALDPGKKDLDFSNFDFQKKFEKSLARSNQSSPRNALLFIKWQFKNTSFGLWSFIHHKLWSCILQSNQPPGSPFHLLNYNVWLIAGRSLTSKILRYIKNINIDSRKWLTSTNFSTLRNINVDNSKLLTSNL